MPRISITLMLCLALGCSILSRSDVADGPVKFQTILAGHYSLADTAAVYLISDDEQWQEIWRIANGRMELPPEPLKVDFTRQAVIAAFMGERSSSGYRIEISSITKKGSKLIVAIKNYETPGMLTVMTYPFHIVKIPKGEYRMVVEYEKIE